MRVNITRAYRESSYSVAGFAFRIGCRDTQLDAILARLGACEAVLLTACNPYSRRMPPGWNTRRMGALGQALHRHRILPGESGAGRWREAQWLVACAPAWGVRLARRFRQNAIVWLRRGHAPRLVWCGA